MMIDQILDAGLRDPAATRRRGIMKKWYKEECEFRVEVTGLCMMIIPKGIVAAEKKAAINTK